jgi:flagellar biosynthesis GTPase FlhF
MRDYRRYLDTVSKTERVLLSTYCSVFYTAIGYINWAIGEVIDSQGMICVIKAILKRQVELLRAMTYKECQKICESVDVSDKCKSSNYKSDQCKSDKLELGRRCKHHCGIINFAYEMHCKKDKPNPTSDVGMMGSGVNDMCGEKLKREKEEKERLEREKEEKERLEREREEEEKLKREKEEKERLERERKEKERLERERKEKERLEKEIKEKERFEKGREEKERREKEELERILKKMECS